MVGLKEKEHYLILSNDLRLHSLFACRVAEFNEKALEDTKQEGETFVDIEPRFKLLTTETELAWKGVILDLDSLGEEKVKTKIESLRKAYPNCRLTLIGNGLFLKFGEGKLKSYAVDYFLPSDISDAEVKNFLATFFEVTPSPASTLSTELLTKYKKNLIEKIENMGQIIEAMVTAQVTIEQMELMRSHAHKIAGSAAPYGYKAVGDLCRELDTYLTAIFKSKPTITIADFDLEKLTIIFNEYYRKILFAFQGISLVAEKQVNT